MAKGLGHVFSSQGIKPHPKKIESISQLPVPKCVHDLKEFLGMLTI